MCLVKVRQEEDVVVPYRRTTVIRRDQSPRRVSHQSVRRVSRTEFHREHESPRPSSSYIAVPAPQTLPIPAPQPAPVFYEPPAPPPPPSMHHHHQERAHYVEVTPHSPRSSYSSHSPSRASDYVVHEREYRRQQRRDYSPEDRSPRYEHFRYVEGSGPEPERYERRRSRSRVRERSVSRAPADYGERVTRERVSVHMGEGRRSRDYRDY